MKTKSIAVPAQTASPSRERYLMLTLIPLGIAFNLALGTVARGLQLPLYLDAVGTLVVTLIAGVRAGMITGVVSFLIGGLLVPVYPFFIGTQAAIALFAGFAARRGLFRTFPRTIITGICLGVVAGVVSAPVIAYLFGGITGSGASLIVAYLVASGENLLKAVLLSGIAAEPLDKTVQCLLAVWLLRGLPEGLLSQFRSGYLASNGFVEKS